MSNENTPTEEHKIPSIPDTAKRFFSHGAAMFMLMMGFLIPALETNLPNLQVLFPNLKNLSAWVGTAGALWKVILAMKEAKQTREVKTA